VIWRKFIAVVEREGKVIAEWQVCSYFIFSLFSFQHFFSVDYPPPAVFGEGRGWAERERRNMYVIVGLQVRVHSPRLDTFLQQMSMLGTHTFFLAFLSISFFGYDELGRE